MALDVLDEILEDESTPASLMCLPQEILVSALVNLGANNLAMCSRVCNQWNEIVVPFAAEQRYRRQQDESLPPGNDGCPCWLRMLAAAEALERHIGPFPRCRDWRSENVPLQVAAAKLRGETFMAEPEWFLPGGSLSIAEE